MSDDQTSRSWIERNGPRAALMSAAVLTFLGEFELARMAHYHWTISIFFPLAIDVYAFTAFHMNRRADVAISLVLMGVANVASHLLNLGLIPLTGTTGITLMIVVVLIPVVIAWRAHSIGKPTQPQPVTTEPEQVMQAEEVTAAAAHSQAKSRRTAPKTKRSKAETAALVHSYMCDNPHASQAAAARALNLSEKWVSQCLKLNAQGTTA